MKAKKEYHLAFQPRAIRVRDAPTYLGIDRNKFDKEVRPLLIAIPMGRQTLVFDRLDLDAWFEEHKERNGRTGIKIEDNLCHARAKRLQALSSEAKSGILTKCSEEREFAKALERATSKKPKKS